MTLKKNISKNYYGDEAPRGKDFLIVILVFLILTALDWVAYFKLGWFH